MDDSYLRNRIHQILEGKIAMGGYRRKSKSRKGSKTRSKSRKGAGTRMGAKHNPWLKHVKAVRRQVGMDVPYKKVLIMASKSYSGSGVMAGGKRRKTKYGSKKRKGGVKAGIRAGVLAGGKRRKTKYGSKKRKMGGRMSAAQKKRLLGMLMKRKRGSGMCDEVCAYDDIIY